MKKLIEGFTQQLAHALKLGQGMDLVRPGSDIRNILITGMGGSGIGANLVESLTFGRVPIPIVVSKGYNIPQFVSPHTLFIACSYSGNTEETLNAMNLALKRKAKIVCVTSGGKVADIAHKQKLDIISIPGGNPPRACLGYSLTQLFVILSYHKIIGNKYKAQLKSAVQLIESEKQNIIAEAKNVTEKLFGKTPMIYATTYFEGVAIRFRHQRRIGQTRANRLRNVERRRPLGNILHASVRKLHMNTVCHKVETCRWTESFSLLEGFGRVKRKR